VSASCESNAIPLDEYYKEFSTKATDKTLQHLKHLKETFKELYWKIINPKGNGLCMLHAIFNSLKLKVNYIDLLLNGFQEYFISNEDIYIPRSNEYFVGFIKEDNPEILKTKITELLDDNNLSSQLINIIILGINKMYNMNVNILELIRDERSKKPYLQTYYKSPLTSSPHIGIILLNDGGHFKSLVADNIQYINDKITNINSGEIKW